MRRQRLHAALLQALTNHVRFDAQLDAEESVGEALAIRLLSSQLSKQVGHKDDVIGDGGESNAANLTIVLQALDQGAVDASILETQIEYRGIVRNRIAKILEGEETGAQHLATIA